MKMIWVEKNYNADFQNKNRQKEFISYLESEIECRELVSDLLFSHNKELKVYREVLKKYKEIIGDVK